MMHLSIKQQLVLAFVALAVVSVGTTAFLMGQSAISKSEDTIQKKVESRLIATRDLKKIQVEDYFSGLRDQVVNMSSQPWVVEAGTEFRTAFKTFEAEQGTSDAGLMDYYTTQFGERYKELNSGNAFDINSIYSGLSSVAKSMQSTYISNNPHPLGEKDQLVSSGSTSYYDELHSEYHSTFRNFLQTYGYYDIFIVEPENGHIIYSVFKELDFATSLDSGPYKDSGIAKAYQAAKQITDPKGSVLIDFASYSPSYDSAASFIASPILDGGSLVGILIYQMPLDRINYLMTNNKQWKEAGFGDTGETYLVGPDQTLRSEVRFLIEDPEGYSKALLNSGEDAQLVNKMTATGTAIGLLKVKTEGASQAVQNQKGVAYFNDYRGEPVISAYTPINILGLKWGLLSEVDEAEAFAGQRALVSNLMNTTLIIAAILISIMAGLGILMAKYLVKPIDDFAKTLRHVTDDNDFGLRFDISQKNEFSVLGQALNELMENLATFIKDMQGTASVLADNAQKLNGVTEQTTEQVHRQSQEVNAAATATTEMNSAVHEVAQSTEDAAVQMQNTKQKVEDSVAIANRTQNDIYMLQKDMSSAINNMTQLETESQGIGEVLDVIQNIAEQTNLLALNAAIEAARAGEQGRGFAVVADEVRTLASRTAQSTDEIRSKIESLQKGVENALSSVQLSQEKTDISIKQVEETVANMNAVSEQVDTTNEMNTHIATATEEQSQVTDEINRNVHHLKDLSDSILEIATNLSTSSVEVHEASRSIYSAIERYKI